LALQMIWLAAGSMIRELLILVGYGVLAGRMQAGAARPGYWRTTHPIAGGLMVGVASLVATLGPDDCRTGVLAELPVSIRFAELLGTRYKVYDSNRGDVPERPFAGNASAIAAAGAAGPGFVLGIQGKLSNDVMASGRRTTGWPASFSSMPSSEMPIICAFREIFFTIGGD
jgi:hypothetical protein